MKTKHVITAIALFVILIFGLFLLFGNKGASQPTPTDTEGVLPFGSGDDTEDSPNQSVSEGRLSPIDSATGEENAQISAFFKISSTPVAGFVILTRASSASTSSPQATVIRYVDRATGNIYEAILPQGSSSMSKNRITNKILPQIYEAYFRDDGNAVVYQTIDSTEKVRNLSLALTPPKATSTETFYDLAVTDLRGTMEGISVGTGDTLYYFLKDSSAVVSSKFNGDKVTTLWNTPISRWRTTTLGKGVVTFSSPSASLPGAAYSLPSLNKLAGPINGLVARGSFSGKYLLYSTSNSSTELRVKDIAKGSTFTIAPETIAEKCAWLRKKTDSFICGAPDGGILGNEPDNWYQGKTHFSDNIWIFDANTETAEFTLEPERQFGVKVDVYGPMVSSDDSYLVFINKTDLSLWALGLR